MDNYKKFTLTLLTLVFLLTAAFFIGRFNAPTKIKTITITTPEIKGSSIKIDYPAPIIQKKDSLIYKDSIIYTDTPYNQELAERYINLSNETDKLKQYLQSIQIRKYQLVTNNDTVSITNDVEVEGVLKSFKQNWVIKEIDLEVPVIQKQSVFALYAGTRVSNNLKLDNFAIEANLGIQNKRGDIIFAGYDTQGNISAGYSFRLLNIKK